MMLIKSFYFMIVRVVYCLLGTSIRELKTWKHGLCESRVRVVALVGPRQERICKREKGFGQIPRNTSITFTYKPHQLNV